MAASEGRSGAENASRSTGVVAGRLKNEWKTCFCLCHSASTGSGCPAPAPQWQVAFFKLKEIKIKNPAPRGRTYLRRRSGFAAESKHQTCATQENGSPARRPRPGWEGEYVQGVALLRVFLVLPFILVKKRERSGVGGKKAPVACISQRLESYGSPSVNAGCGSPLLRGISAVNKSRLLSLRITQCYG